MSKVACTTRRQFLKAAGAAVAAPFVITSSLKAQPRTPANDRIVMATIGTGGQGTGDMNGFMGFAEVQMVAVCDPVPEHREKARSVSTGATRIATARPTAISARCWPATTSTPC